MIQLTKKRAADPIALAYELWPGVRLYKEQREILTSIWENEETIVPAANQLGKDFVGGLAVLLFFLTRHPCRIVTTSAKEEHLKVLWGEIGRFVQTCSSPLDYKLGGPLILNHQNIRKIHRGEVCRISYITGLVASQDSMAAMQGHHATPDNIEDANDGIPRTLFVCDEASSVRDSYYTMAKTWAKRTFVFGNCWPCDNFFKHAVKGKAGTKDRGGDLKASENGHYIRKIIRIKAEDSPNVRLGLLQEKRKEQPTNEVIIPGVKGYSDYKKDRQLLEPDQQCVRLDADWYEGPEIKLFPPEWLNRAERIAELLRGKPRRAKGIGIDTAEGGDFSSWTAVDELGIIKQVNKKTPDTSEIPGFTIAFAREHGITESDAGNICFDRGGGGKEHADILRRRGWNVRTVAFGEESTTPNKYVRRLKTGQERMLSDEVRSIYKNRRAEMYWLLRLLLDPAGKGELEGFGIPREYSDLTFQLSKIPKWQDDEGRWFLPPKNRRPDLVTENKKVTLIDLIGRSPDEADSTVLAVFAMKVKPTKARAGIMV